MDDPTIKDIGRLARKIDQGAFDLNIGKGHPRRAENIERRMKALTEARLQLQDTLREG